LPRLVLLTRSRSPSVLPSRHPRRVSGAAADLPFGDTVTVFGDLAHLERDVHARVRYRLPIFGRVFADEMLLRVCEDQNVLPSLKRQAQGHLHRPHAARAGDPAKTST